MLPPAVAGIGLLAAVGPRGLLAPLGVSFTLSTAAVVVALTFVAAPFYLRQAQSAFAALDRVLARRVADAGRGRGADAGAGRDPGRAAGAVGRARAGLGPRAGRVRRDADVRRLLPGRHADRAAGDLRALLDRLHRRARAVGGARVRVGGAAAGGQARRSVLRVELADRARGARRSRSRSPTASASRWPGRRARARRPCCRPSRGCSGPSGASSRAATTCGSTPRAASTCAPERRRCGYVFQDYALFGHLSAWRNVAYGIDGGDRRERAHRAAGALRADARARTPSPAQLSRRRAPAGRGRARAGARAAASCCSTSRCPRSTRARAPRPRAS